MLLEKVTWGFMDYKADPQKAYEEIVNHGEITPENVLEVARNPKSEIHNDFEWDDSVAGERYRLIQARKMIQCFVIERKKDKGEEPQRIRAVQISSTPNVYKPVQFFVKHVDEYEKLLKRAIQELKDIQKRYSTLTELESVFEAINEL